MNNKNIKYLYEKFHQNSSLQKHIISAGNYTYFNITNVCSSILRKRKNQKILDFGCGVGTIATFLAAKGHLVTGIDISEKSIHLARRNAINANLSENCKFFVLEKEYQIKKDDNKYDVICLFEVIEHLDNDRQILEILIKKMKIGSKMIISTRSKNSLIYRLGIINSFEKRVGHVRRYDNESIIDLFQQPQLRILSIDKVDSILRDILYCLHIFGHLLKFIRGPIAKFAIAIEKPLIAVFGNSGYILVLEKKTKI